MSGNTDTATIVSTTGVLTGIRAGTAIISYSLPTGCSAVRVISVDPTPPAITGNLHVCIGSSVTLANGMPGGIWYSSNPAVAVIGSGSGIVSSVSLGTSYISYVMPATACFAVKTVTVQPLPVIYSVTGGGNYCASGAGMHVGLTGSQPGVSYVLYYGSAVTGYMPGTGFPLDFGALTPGGIYTVQATNVTSGCVRDMTGSASIMVVPLVAPVVTLAASPDDSVCPGNSVTVSPMPVHGGLSPTYSWQVNGAPVSAGTSYTFIPADHDVVTVAMTSNASCITTSSATGSVTLNVLTPAAPAVSVVADPGDTVCQHTHVTYTAIPAFGGYNPSYVWRVNGAIVGTGLVYAYNPLPGDVVNVFMTSDYRCRLADNAISGDMVMDVEPMTTPIVKITPDPGFMVPEGTPVTLRTTVTNAGPSPTYKWRMNGMPVPGATEATYTHVFHDYDSVVCAVTSNGACPGITGYDWIFISVYPLGLQQQQGAATIRLTPNPNNGNFTISGDLGTLSSEPVSVTVTDMLGQVVYTGEVTPRNGRIDQSLSMSNNLANGMYMLSMAWGSDRQIFHFVIRQ